MEALKHQQIQGAIEQAKHVLILPDESIDGDSLGSALALYRYLDRLGKQTTIVCAEEIPEKYQFLNHTEECSSDSDRLNDQSIDLVIFVDCSRPDYVADRLGNLPRRVPVINIDHHDSNQLYGDIAQVDTDSASTTEIVHRFFKEVNAVVDPEMATALLTGIYYDTTVFSNKSTRERSLAIAAELFMSGARVQEVVRYLQLNRSLAILKLWGLAFERLVKHPELDVVTTWITEQDVLEIGGGDLEGLDGFTNFLHGVIDADTVVFLREAEDGVRGSLRTMTGDVAALARTFGGGGHAKAAGFFLPGAKLNKNGKLC